MAVCALILFLATATLSAQLTSNPHRKEHGEELFRANCAVCHGPDGDSVPDVDLGHGKFRRASSDDDLIQIIKTGIPGTAMPPNDVTDAEAAIIIEYLRSLASLVSRTSLQGDAIRGKALFEGKGGCLKCHRVREQGSRLGPDLSEIGAQRRSVELERSILEPDAEVLPQNRFLRVVTRDGATITGRILNRDAFTVQLIDSEERLLSFQISNLKEYVFLEKSLMPSYQSKLSPQELANIVSYLVSLKGVGQQ